MPTRRDFLRAGAALTLLPLAGCPRRTAPVGSVVVNDIHSQLNATRVDRVLTPNSVPALREILHEARREGKKLCVAGGRHAMGGQQFAADALLIDTTQLNRVISFDVDKGIIEIEAGIQWPELVSYLVSEQGGQARQWGIRQKQTGADRLCLGGALASNIHGRGLEMRPLIADVEAFTLLDAEGHQHRCSRRENADLFRLAIGGYGLFGVIATVALRLAPRQKVQRMVEIITLDELIEAFAKRIREGFLYGDFQYSTDETSDNFLWKGVFSCYRPLADATLSPDEPKQISERQWREMLYLAHHDKARAYQLYTEYYLSTSEQIYWSDTHQLSAYLDDYHQALDKRSGATQPATEIITEIYVPRGHLRDFMREAREDLRKNNVNVIYGTIRLIERDTESFLAWAKQSYAGVIFNLHTEHTPDGREHSARAFRRLIDMAIRRGGSYYLTYHRAATRKQVEACYPRFAAFLRLKQKHDPQERFQSEWYRHYKKLFAV